MLYDALVPAYANGLRALSGQLDKALAWGEENSVGELQFMAARLAPDMFPLATQVRFSCLQAVLAPVRLGAEGAPEFADDAGNFAGLQQQIAAALDWLDGLDRAALGADGDRPFSFTLPNGMTFDMTAATYVRDWAHPQYYFHIVAAYAVLRHMGVPLGKADYVSYMTPYLRPGTAPGL
ncbi:MAG: DUF1993 domain-containing protein [Alphaproteobacteria bacterium HGW-Alphaproteobacteria-13]|jgi:hypothetical protein|nr:MAG: DUF1993 domain-containing protein [Alphaproteobacteria bacterium HGW-Alphaproteobacteria-13]